MRKLLLLGLAGLVLGCSPKSVVDPSASRIRIFYNNDLNAYLAPCGCRVSPIGGMDRRWNAMKAYPDESRVLVDAGNFLFKSAQSTDYLAPQWYEQAVGVVEAYNLLHADAVAIGETEFALGVQKFQEIAKQAKFPFISANVYWKGTSKLFLRDSVMIERYGKKIGIFGLFLPSLKLPPELEAKDPVSHAQAMVKKLRAQGADMVIALSHQGYDEDVKLANAVSGIDLLVGASSQSLLQKPDVENDTLLVQLSNQGQVLGMVEYEAKTLPKQRTNFVVAELDGQFNDGPPGLANPMKTVLAVTNLRMTEANKKLDEKIWAAHEGKADGFQTFLSCRDCHNKQAAFQENKRHAAAFLTLLAKKQENNLDCVKCHSVGMGAPGGFTNLNNAFFDAQGKAIPFAKLKDLAHPEPGTDYRANPAAIKPHVARWISSLEKAGVKKAFVSVQCENCHGPRPGHPFDNQLAGTGKVNANLCLQCHTKEQMPAWYDHAGKLDSQALAGAVKAVACPR